jgi:hypothetical protein
MRYDLKDECDEIPKIQVDHPESEKDRNDLRQASSEAFQEEIKGADDVRIPLDILGMIDVPSPKDPRLSSCVSFDLSCRGLKLSLTH